jgi:hypothetical protein
MKDVFIRLAEKGFKQAAAPIRNAWAMRSSVALEPACRRICAGVSWRAEILPLLSRPETAPALGPRRAGQRSGSDGLAADRPRSDVVRETDLELNPAVVLCYGLHCP